MFPAPAWSGPQSDAELLDWLRLIRSQNIGSHTFWTLLSRYGSAANALEALPDIAQRAGGKSRRISLAGPQEVEREVNDLTSFGAKLVALGQSSYPPLLARVDAPPPILTVLGDSAIATTHTIGIVGARNASASGRRIAEMLAGDLGRNGLTIASGLARGVDTHAHTASLATGTVAVTAGGINRIYPKENADLHARIAQTGAVVTEMPFNAEPVAKFFPRRNRIISGMSAGVVVVEAATRSGSLITARFAAEQGREVFAVPGSPLDQRTQGTNALIRNGATLVQSAQDVLEAMVAHLAEPLDPQSAWTVDYEVPAEPIDPPTPHPEPTQTEFHQLLSLLSPTPMPIDDLARLSSLPAESVNAIVVELEIGGKAQRHPGGTVSLA